MYDKFNSEFYNIFMCVHANEYLKLLDVVQVIVTDEVLLFQTSRKQRTAYEKPLSRLYNTTLSGMRMEVRSSFFLRQMAVQYIYCCTNFRQLSLILESLN
jgi:hypothetical protein